jgi:hypothetical protein
MQGNPVNSFRSLLAICIVAAVAMVFAAGTANAQIIILENDEVRLEDDSTGQTARIYYGGDLYLGGSGWTGEIYLQNYLGATVVSVTASGTMSLGTTTDDGDLYLRNSSGSNTISMDGTTGTLTNDFAGNGLVKAWARINSDGTVASCWRCNTSVSETYNTGTGYYYVDFTFATDISSRPLSATIDSHSTGLISHGEIMTGFVSGDPSSVWVRTASETGTAGNRPFTLVIY